MKKYSLSIIVLVLFGINCKAQDTVQYMDPYYWFNQRNYYIERYGFVPWNEMCCHMGDLDTHFAARYYTPEQMLIYGVAFTADTQGLSIDKYDFELNLAQLRNDSLFIIDSTRWKPTDARVFFTYSIPSNGTILEKTVPCFELYFDTPRMVHDTFFVGRRCINGAHPHLYMSYDSSSSFYVQYPHNQMANVSACGMNGFETLWGILFPIIQPNRHCSVPAAPRLLVYNATNTVRFTLPYSPEDSLILSVARYGQPADSGMIYPVTDSVFDLVIPDSGRYTAQLGRICPRYGGIILQSEWGDPTTFLIMNNLSIEQSSIPTLEVYPNPTDGTVRIGAEGIREVWCVAADGKRTQLSVKNGQVSLKDYPAGLYVLEIQTDEGLYTAKVVRR